MKLMTFSAIGVATLMIAGSTALIAQQEKAAAPRARADVPKRSPAELKRDSSYGMGLAFARSLKEQEIDVDIDQLVEGARAGLGQGKPRFTDAQLDELMSEFRDSLIARQRAKMAAVSDKNKAAGSAYMAENRKKQGVVVTKSGVQIETLKEGTGKTPKATDKVKVHYRGTLTDGTEFDSSIKRGEPITFPLNGVIKGWTEALQQMKVGSKARVVIPPELAYGEDSPTELIPPNSTLVFEIELLGIE